MPHSFVTDLHTPGASTTTHAWHWTYPVSCKHSRHRECIQLWRECATPVTSGSRGAGDGISALAPALAPVIARSRGCTPATHLWTWRRDLTRPAADHAPRRTFTNRPVRPVQPLAFGRSLVASHNRKHTINGRRATRRNSWTSLMYVAEKLRKGDQALRLLGR